MAAIEYIRLNRDKVITSIGRVFKHLYLLSSEIPPLLAERTFLASGEAENLLKELAMVV